MATDIIGQLQGLAQNPQALEQLKGLLPEGTDFGKLLEDPAKLLDTFKNSPDLLAKVQEFLPGVDIQGALSGLTGAAGAAGAAAAGAAGAAAGAATDAAGAAAGAAEGAADAATGAAGAAADAGTGAAGEATEAAGGIIDKIKGLFRG